MSARRLFWFFLLILFFTNDCAIAQRLRPYSMARGHDRRSLFVHLGYTSGPRFTDFVDWANDYYARNFLTNEKMADFSGGVDFSIGIRNRFAPYFAVEFDASFHSVGTSQRFTNSNPDLPLTSQGHNLDLDVAKFTASVPVIFEFSANQPVVPFVAAGVSAFSLRLDHRIYYTVRNTKVALAANFSFGADLRLTPQIFLDFRTDWTGGRTRIETAQLVGQPGSFKLNLSTWQLHAGVLVVLD